MKLRFYLLSLLIAMNIGLVPMVQAQDSITYNDLQQFAHPFTISGESFAGEGGAVLSESLASSHITMLGDNLGSMLEHQFTNALINEMDKNDYSKMVLEVGEGSGKVINRMVRNEELTVQNIKAMNQKYKLEKGESIFVPIVELKRMEGAENLHKAMAMGWDFLSVGMEPWSSYQMLVDEMYNNLYAQNKEANQELYEEVKGMLTEAYDKLNAYNSDEVYQLISHIRSSDSFTRFLDKMTVCSGNVEIAQAIRQSIEYWWMYGNKEFYKKNMWSAEQDKTKLKEELKNINFDFSKDKLFVKMWRNHVSKGLSPSGTYGLGNMLKELADYHGASSLNIGIVRRFSKVDGEVIDAMVEQDYYTKLFKDIVQLGKMEEWVLVDMRPFIENFYYGNYIISDGLYRMIARYDMIVIPPVDEVATPNY